MLSVYLRVKFVAEKYFFGFKCRLEVKQRNYEDLMYDLQSLQDEEWQT